MIKLVIVGASSFVELSELIDDINEVEEEKIQVIALLDDNPDLHGSKIEGIEVVGGVDYAKSFNEEVKFVFAIGSYKTHLKRREILNRLNIRKERFYSLIHPTVKIYKSSYVGNGVIIHYGSIVFNNTSVEDHCIIMANTVIGARNLIGEGVLITSSVCTTNNVKIGSYSFVGTNSSIAENVVVAPGCMIGMNSMVASSTREGEVRFGIPARIIDKKEISEEILNIWEINKDKYHEG